MAISDLQRMTLRRVLVATAFAVAVGCTSDGNGGTGPNGSDGAISIAVSQNTATISQAGSIAITATVTRSGGFTGSITFALADEPAGVTASASDLQTSDGVTTATITISAEESVIPDVYTFTVRASGNGVEDTSVSFQLTVTELVEFALAVNPSGLSLQQGTTGVTQVTISRVNFSDPVDLSLENVPEDPSGRPGVAAVFNPTLVTGDASTLTLTVGQSIQPGQYGLTILGVADSVSRRTTLTLTVTATPNYTLTLNPPTLTIEQGSSGQTTITINRTNFDGDVSLAVSGAPTGITTTLDPAATTGTTATLTVNVDATVAADGYTLTVTGSSSLGDRTVQLPITVTEP